MIKYDVGILSFWNVPNYGTFAQAYALQCVMAKLFPNRDVKQINYLNKRHYNFYYSIIPPFKITSKRFYKSLPEHITKGSGFNKRREMFLKSYQFIPHTEKLVKKLIAETDFDTVVLGSDIVWDYSFRVFNHDCYLFGNEMNSKKLISYAASFGTIKKGQQHPKYVIDGLKNMNYISVRDENSADIVEEITGERPQVVLDPTWLWDFASDENIVEPKFKRYIIIYGQDFTDKFIEELICYAHRHEYKLICLDCNNDRYDWCDVLLKQHELTPFEWMGLFKGADIIASSTFHGLTFALIFNKPLAFCRSDFIIAKVGSFLKKLGLYELLEKSGRSIQEMMDFSWDYIEINRILDYERNKSIVFLKKAIVGKKYE